MPSEPGVYLFYGSRIPPIRRAGKPGMTQREVLYVGKAKNLKSRLSSYFGIGLIDKTARLMSEAHKLSYIKVNSEIEALLLEARLVRRLMPKYNSELKDDKSPLYIGITKDKYPRVVTLRQTQLEQYELKNLYGPFVNSGSVRQVMKFLRRVVPYSQHKPSTYACVYNQIGLCDPCPSLVESEHDKEAKNILRRKYLKNMRILRAILEGQFKSITRRLAREMKELSKIERYEEAGVVYNRIRMLEEVTSPPVVVEPYLDNPNFVEDIRKSELKELLEIVSEYLDVKDLGRIECFDVAHLAGTHPTASMVTFIGGEAEKKYYRHFKVKLKRGLSDYDSMKSILKRRSKHFETWGRPDMILVDGGKPQVKAAVEVFGKAIPTVGIAKRLETLVFFTTHGFEEKRLERGPALYLVQRMRDEAHRFARRLHHNRLRKAQFMR